MNQPGQNQGRLPINFTQPDTEVLKREIIMLRSLEFPLNKWKRVQAMNTMKSFALQYDVTIPKGIELDDYISSVEKFEAMRAPVMKKMYDKLSKFAVRDQQNMKDVLGGGMDFGSEGEGL